MMSAGCPHGYALGEECPSGFCGDGSGTGVVVESDRIRLDRAANVWRPLSGPEVAERVEGHLVTAARCLARAEPVAGAPIGVVQADLLRAQVALGWAFVEALRAVAGLPGIPAEPEGKAT